MNLEKKKNLNLQTLSFSKLRLSSKSLKCSKQNHMKMHMRSWCFILRFTTHRSSDERQKEFKLCHLQWKTFTTESLKTKDRKLTSENKQNSQQPKSSKKSKKCAKDEKEKPDNENLDPKRQKETRKRNKKKNSSSSKSSKCPLWNGEEPQASPPSWARSRNPPQETPSIHALRPQNWTIWCMCRCWI